MENSEHTFGVSDLPQSLFEAEEGTEGETTSGGPLLDAALRGARQKAAQEERLATLRDALSDEVKAVLVWLDADEEEDVVRHGAARQDELEAAVETSSKIRFKKGEVPALCPLFYSGVSTHMYLHACTHAYIHTHNMIHTC